MFYSNQGRPMSTPQEIAVEAMKAAPPVTIGALQLAGVSLSDWLLIATLLYTVLQIGFLLHDKWWKRRHYQGNERRRGK